MAMAAIALAPQQVQSLVEMSDYMTVSTIHTFIHIDDAGTEKHTQILLT